jgi:C4-dicarboxylate transporter DctM subunit
MMVGGPVTIAVLAIALLLIGIPVAYVLFIGASLGLYLLIGSPAASTIGTTPFEVSSSFTFIVVPLFILMAEFLGASGITKNIFKAINIWTQKIPGGMAIAAVIANGGMAVMSGSSAASAATMAKVSIPEMRRFGYKDTLSAGTVSAAGTFASMLPPSLILIVYGIITETSIGALFLGGVTPGVLTLLAYVVVIMVWLKMDPEVARDTLGVAADGGQEKTTTGREDGTTSEQGRAQQGADMTFVEKLQTTKDVFPGLLLIVIVLAGIYGGYMTPTEAGAVGAFGALVISLVYGLRWDGTKEALDETILTTGKVFLIIVGATMLSHYLGFTGTIQQTITLVNDLGLFDWQTLVILLVIYLALGTILDPLGILVLTLPLTFPIVTTMGYEGVWFGVVVIKTIEMGLVTPPFGLNVYIVSGSIDVDIQDVFKGAAPFLLADLAVLILMVVFPEVVMWLPNSMG